MFAKVIGQSNSTGSYVSALDRTMRALDLSKPTVFTYNLLERLELTEDRTIKYEFYAKDLVARGRPYVLASGQKDTGGPMDETGVPVVRKPYNIRQITLALAKATGRSGAA